MSIVDDQGPFGAYKFYPGRGKVRIGRRQDPTRADRKHHTIIHGNHNPLAIVNAVSRVHNFTDSL